ncbi:hypothetical protein FRB95_002748 [Tulasnella sp. JGI-2019a]|nr:hypothetical protein FRB95_002748 [Tulasnella sp. JGI-2019a]
MISKLTIHSTTTLSSGKQIPLLGLGVWKNRSPVPACSAAFDAGYRHVDCAILYKNEEEVGVAIRGSDLKREDIFITSKVISRWHGYDMTLKAIDDSLDRFKLDYLDLYLIHEPLSGKAKRLETWRALIKRRDDGKLKSIGVSNYGIKHLEEIKEAGLETPSVNQIELHPWCQQRPIVDYCQKNNIVIEAYSPLTRGQNLDDPTLQNVAKKYHKDGAQILIRYSLQKGWIPLPKSSQPQRVLSNAQVYDFELDTDDMGTLDSLDRGKDGAVTRNQVDAP